MLLLLMIIRIEFDYVDCKIFLSISFVGNRFLSAMNENQDQ
jgi:hypothetical protein